MWKQVLFLLIITQVFADPNRQNYFPSFICDNVQKVSPAIDCKITEITSEDELKEIFNKLATKEFKYYICEGGYNCYYEGYNKLIRKDLTEYPFLTFENSKFQKFPSGTFSKLMNIKTLKAIDVGLTELNRDDLKSFKSVRILNLAKNNLRSLGNVVLLHLEALSELHLPNNQIESIHENAFDECSKNLTFIDLAHNKLTSISENIFDILGKNLQSSIYFDFNEIEEIIPSASPINSSRNFSVLSVSDNKLKKFNYNCTKVNKLYLDSNLLEEISIGGCIVDFLNVTKNSLTTVNASTVIKLFTADNPKLQNLTLVPESLVTLHIRNIPAKIVTFDIIKTAHKLMYLDATNTFLGSIKIDTFSDLKFLQTLKLSRTGLSHIDYGMFSHQTELKILDVSYNNLPSIDIKMLTSLKDLQTLDISGNNLTNFENVKEIKNIFQDLEEIGIADNNWNCSYLASIYKIFEDNSISVLKPSNVVKNSSNVMGIGCMTSSQLNIKPLDADKQNEALVQKINELVDEFNAEKTKNNNKRYDGDIIKAELFHIQREILELKSKNLKDQLNVANGTDVNDRSSADLSVITKMMEQLNNLTLEKQKLANDQLLLKIDKLQIELHKRDMESDKFVLKSQLNDLISDNQKTSTNNISPIKYEYIKSPDVNENKTTSTLIIIMATALVIFGALFGYAKVKNIVKKQNNLMSVRARSTNTINTTVEMPFT